MTILLLGSGGREHALAWKLAQSKLCSRLFISPGNAGTAQCGTNVPVYLHGDFSPLIQFCQEQSVGLLVIGPEEPLVNGIVDALQNDPVTASISVVGPSRAGAMLEGSKAFAKKFMQRHGIPTASYREFDLSNYEEGIPYIQQHALPVVLKADGLAAGKGVVICQSHVEAIAEYELMIQQSKFGEAGKRVVIEKFLDGIELSVFVLTDGKDYVLLPEAKDYKRVGEGDKGLNTGGMGAVSPVPFAGKEFMKKVEERIIRPTIRGLSEEKIEYRGFVFFGLIKVGEDPFVIEYNCRMGDPETEVVIPRIQNDLVELLLATGRGELKGKSVHTDPRSACTVMAVSGGYPGIYEKGFEISGLDIALPSSSQIFHAGTREEDGQVITTGGRVLCVTSFGESIPAAVEQSLEVLDAIHFEGMYFRRDIGFEFKAR